jgi:biotin carboxylase
MRVTSGTGIASAGEAAGRAGLLLVVGSGCRACREYGLRSMASRYPLVVADDSPPTWQLFAAEHVTTPLTSSGPLLDALADRNIRVAGVVTYVEQYLPIAAEVAAALGLPHSSVPAVQACRDKLLSRQLLAAAGVPSARSIPVRSLADAQAAADEIGYPVVVKPRALAGSLGVTLVATAAELERAFALAADSRLDGVDEQAEAGLLIEQYLDGPQISVECASFGGQTTAAAVTDHIVEFPPYFEQGGHVVDMATPLDTPRAAAVEVARAALDALGFTVGVSHTELRLTRDGPRIVEVNGRLAGSRIPYLWRLACGADLALAAADVAMGAVPDLVPKWRAAAGIRHLYPPVAGRIVALNADPGLWTRPWFHELTWEKATGEHVRPAPNAIDDVLGYVIVTGSDGDECRRRLDEAASAVDIRIARSQSSLAVAGCAW